MNKKNLLKNVTKIWIAILFIIFSITLIPHNIYAEENDLKVEWFNIMPELTEKEIESGNAAVITIWQSWWEVRKNYNKAASGLSTSQQIATWIMNWDTIMNYLVFIVQFLSQLWLFVGFWFIMYAGYTYMLSVFNWKQAKSSTITNAIIWIAIVIFSYAIMRILTSIIGIS